MIKPSSKNINFLAFIISIMIFGLISFIYDFWVNSNQMKFQVSVNSPQLQEKINYNADVGQSNNSELVSIEKNTAGNIEENTKDNQKLNYNWIIEIPEINLVAEISEGTSKEVMDKYVGHFTETQLEYGNIGLAAHNRGYPVNYFQDLKKLKEGSQIIYKHGEFNMMYEVKKMEIIEITNWDYLEKTEDNRITLITCVENEPKYRRCIQGVETIESEEY